MMDERLALAALFVGAGLLIGALTGWFVRRRLLAARGGEATSSIAGAAGVFAFWIFTVAGTLAAVALVNPDTLEDVPRQALDYTPRVLAAGLIVFGGYATAVISSRFISFGLERASGRTTARVATLVRMAVLSAAAILALAQLGVDTTILVLLIAIAGSGLALSSALLVGFGGRDIAREIAAGRYLTRYLTTGTTVQSGSESGKIIALHPATAEIETADGHKRHVPYSRLLKEGVTLMASPDEGREVP